MAAAARGTRRGSAVLRAPRRGEPVRRTHALRARATRLASTPPGPPGRRLPSDTSANTSVDLPVPGPSRQAARLRSAAGCATRRARRPRAAAARLAPTPACSTCAARPASAHRRSPSRRHGSTARSRSIVTARPFGKPGTRRPGVQNDGRLGCVLRRRRAGSRASPGPPRCSRATARRTAARAAGTPHVASDHAVERDHALARSAR